MRLYFIEKIQLTDMQNLQIYTSVQLYIKGTKHFAHL